jgi:uncharacterized protein (DUF1697 family)
VPDTYVALLRGVNVGGRNLISMPDVKDVFRGLGLRDVRTYLVAGNVIFAAEGTDARRLEATIEEAFASRFPQPVSVIVRDIAEMKQIVEHIPEHWTTGRDQKCNVMFLRRVIDSPKILENFSPKPDIEELHYYPGVLFWSARTDSLTKSTMLKVSTMPVYQDITVRILQTTRKIYEIMQETAASATGA